MAGFRIRIHPSAYLDIESAADWIAENAAPEKAVEWLEALHECIDTLKSFPERCPRAKESGKWGPEELRQLLFQAYPSKYRILFHVSGDTVHVLQVRHGSRRWMHEGN
jgi:plasmid stabilization system protein ParE